jgi:hypothetical protein
MAFRSVRSPRNKAKNRATHIRAVIALLVYAVALALFILSVWRFRLSKQAIKPVKSAPASTVVAVA